MVNLSKNMIFSFLKESGIKGVLESMYNFCMNDRISIEGVVELEFVHNMLS